MSTVLHKKSILKKTFEVGSSTLLSRFFGIIREVLMVRYLGAGAISDGFLTAYKIPNLLRKIFAEGALSAVFIPTLVGIVRKDKKQANSLISLGFLVFESFLLVACALIMWHARTILELMVPGWPAEQITATVPFLRILMPFILFLSSSALLASALQSVGHFFVPAFAPILLNIVFIGSLLICMFFSLPVEYFCVFILFGGLVQFIFHLIAYIKLHFAFGPINQEAKQQFKAIILRFLPCVLTISAMEIALLIDTRFASYLPAGTISLLNYANRFMNIPLGVFAVAFSTILLPHFSRVAVYAPKRLSFYLLETTKFVFWVTVPATIVMSFFAEKIFLTIFLSKKFSLAQVYEAKTLLIAFSLGLFFFSLNKILLSLYYALHVTWIPTIISIITTLLNIALDYVLMTHFQSIGLALATTISMGVVQTLLFVVFLRYYFKFSFYLKNFLNFFIRYTAQLALILTASYGLYRLCLVLVAKLPITLASFMLNGLGFWFWVGPLCGAAALTIFCTRRLFNIKLHFLD
ncbi:MAG: murein biosynthesis integral membrane protein MurJ [Candidatus Dependentiae bacterium]|nr:murein biosynthesis integral membrane protein MurJ [Candidatus Dependentiae bacterium]